MSAHRIRCGSAQVEVVLSRARMGFTALGDWPIPPGARQFLYERAGSSEPVCR